MDMQKLVSALARVEPDWFSRENHENYLLINRPDRNGNFWHEIYLLKLPMLKRHTDVFLGAVIDAAQARGWGMILIAPREGASRATIVSPTPICELADQEHSILAVAAALALLEAHGVRV